MTRCGSDRESESTKERRPREREQAEREKEIFSKVVRSQSEEAQLIYNIFSADDSTNIWTCKKGSSLHSDCA